MKTRIISWLLVLALLTTAAVFTVQANDDTIANQIAAGNQICINSAAQDFTDYDPATQTMRCYACGEDVTWTALTDADFSDRYYIDKNNHTDSDHYYLAEDITFENNSATIALDIGSTRTACLHLNGKNFTAADSANVTMIYSKGILNIMGSGVVTGNRTSSSSGTTLYTNSGNGTINMYGGTYKKANVAAPIVQIKSSHSANFTMYGTTVDGIYYGAVLEGNGNVEGNETGSSVYLNNANAQFNMYGGIIRNGYSANGGNVYVAAGAFNMYAGTIQNGTALNGTESANGGNVYIASGAAFDLQGGYVIDGTSYAGGCNIYCLGTLNMNGGQISGGTRPAGSQEGLNVMLSEATMTMTGGWIISEEGAKGNGIMVRKSTLMLGGNAKVTGPNGEYTDNIYVYSTGKLIVDNGFKGDASADWVSNLDVSGYGETFDSNYGACGDISAETFAAAGTYTGTLLHEGFELANIFGVDGQLVLAGAQLVAADGSEDWYIDANAAAADYAEGDYIQLRAAENKLTASQQITYTININGKALELSGSGTVAGMDTKNNGYDATACGTAAVAEGAAVTFDTVCDAPNDRTYVAVEALDGTYSFHRLNMEITAVSLRTSTGGIYYWADWDCDSTLAANIQSYGIACQMNTAPTAQTLSAGMEAVAAGNKSSVLYSQLTNSEAGDEIFANPSSDDETTGAIMNNIISDTAVEGYTNDARGKTPIYAEPYIILAGGEAVVADTATNYSLYTVCQAIDGMIGGMEDSQTKTDHIAYMNDLFTNVWGKYELGWSFVNFANA